MSEKQLTVAELQAIQRAEQEAARDSMEQLTILMDWSPSMDDTFKHGSGSKWDAATKALDMLWKKTSWDICNPSLHLFASQTTPKPFTQESFPKLDRPFGGGTSFVSALRAGIEDKAHRMILISDGEASFPDQEIAYCREHQIVVDTIYIEGTHDYGGKGPKILEQISEMTGGMFTSVDNAESLMDSLLELETGERLLIGGPGDESIKL